MGYAEKVNAMGSGGGAALARATFTYTTPSIAGGATDSSGAIGTGKTALFLKITTDKPARVRFYASIADMEGDLSRPVTSEVTAGKGVILEVVTATGLMSIDLGPMVVASDLASPVVGSIPLAVQNLSGSAGTITVTLVAVQLE